MSATSRRPAHPRCEQRRAGRLRGSWALAILVASCGGDTSVGEAPPRPDVLLIVADDLGYGDLRVYGGALARTPHLDRLAAEGVRFSQGYVSAPACAVSRAALLTGRDHNRYGYRDPGIYAVEVIEQRPGLSTSEILLSTRLREAGYTTGAFGKWHLGSNEPFRPTSRGFDTFFGFLSGAHDYFDWGDGPWGPVWRDRRRASGSGYLTDAITREAVAFIEAHAGLEPFFAYVAYGAIHSPFQAPEDRLGEYAGLPADQRMLAAMIASLDAGVGRLLETLQRLGIEDSTLVIFLSDNGGAFSSNGALRGSKSTLFEGGIRVPFLARWPGVLPAGEVYAQPVSSLDVVPTVAAAAGAGVAEGPELDGVDLLPYLRGERLGAPHETLAWRWRDQWAIRSDSLKLVHSREGAEGVAETALFDLSSDSAETRDLSRDQPDALRRLARRMKEWKNEVARDTSRPSRAGRSAPGDGA